MQTHLKGYVSDYDKLTKAGAEIIVCVAVNDAFVMEAWGDASGAKGKVWEAMPCTLQLHMVLSVPVRPHQLICLVRRDFV
jgi:hypothetical protein